jgi:predicted Fe-Mo cluster-binding NifX family protein
MKIVISSTGRDIESNIDATFHRCPFFLIFDTETDKIKTLENTSREHHTEIGATVGQIVANEGVDTVLTTNIGPKAFGIFEQYGIKMYQAEGKVNEAIQKLKNGKLSEIIKATIFG